MGTSDQHVALGEPGLRCTACSSVVGACLVCNAGFLVEHVIRCHGDSGHTHAACATSRMLRPHFADRTLPRIVDDEPAPRGGRRR